MTELSALHVKITGDANGLNAALGSTQKGLETFRKSAETSAKVFERAFAGSEKSLDQLRRAIDPVYAASKRYESAVETLDNALKMGTVTQAQHARMLDQVGQAYLRNQGAAQNLGGRMGFLGNVSEQTRGKIQQVGFQVQDFAVQVGAGTSATQAFAQQFPQLAGAFGPVGVAIGTLAAIGIPLLVAAFGSASEASDGLTASAERQKTAIEGLIDATQRLALENDMAAAGVKLAEEQRALNEIKRLTEERVALEAQLAQELNYVGNARAAALKTEREAKRAAVEARIAEIDAALEGLRVEQRRATAIENSRKIAEAYRNLQSQIASANISGPWQNVLGSIQAAINKAREYAAAASMSGGKQYGGRGASPGGPLVGSADLAAIQAGGGVIRPFQPVSAGGGGGGGGGGGANPMQGEIDSLRQSLLSKEEIELESYAKRQEALQAALDQRLLTEDEYRRLSEEAQRQHADKMTGIDAWRYGDGLAKAGVFFKSMAEATQGGNEKMQAISKKFAAAEALINAWRAFNQTLADPKLPFFAKFAAAGKVLAAGMGAVNAIRGGGGGSRSAGSVASAGGGGSASAETPGQTLNFTIQNDPFGIGERTARMIADRLNEAGRNGVNLRATISSA